MRGEKTSKYNGVAYRPGMPVNSKRWFMHIKMEGYLVTTYE
jgi:hypothetical protein